MQPVTIKLFLTQGNPESLRTAEISNWTGKAISEPRTELRELLKRDELDRPGVYILTGTDPESNQPVIYIGEADSVADRIKGHSSKDFWFNVVALVSKDENLTKAHSQYLEGLPLPKGYNAVIMSLKRQFAEEVKHRQAEREYTPSLTQGQRYVLRELRVLFNATEDEDTKVQINILEAAFRGTMTRALAQELNRLRRNGITGQSILKSLGGLYYQHNMRDWIDRRGLQIEEQQSPVIVCSEGLH